MAVRALQQGDHKRAIELLEPLGQGGDSRAQTLLGEQYEQGRGALQSDFQAYIWYSLAARRGSNNAVTAKARVAARLQPAEVQQGDRQADRLAGQWRRSAAGGQK
jgi:TPR repeat protein